MGSGVFDRTISGLTSPVCKVRRLGGRPPRSLSAQLCDHISSVWCVSLNANLYQILLWMKFSW